MRTYGFGTAELLMSKATPRSNHERLSKPPAALVALPAWVSTTAAVFCNTSAPAEEATHMNVPLFAPADAANPVTTNGTPTYAPKSPPVMVPL